MPSISMPHSLLDEVINHCRGELPREACGLLAGPIGKVVAVIPIPNVASEPRQHFLADADKQAEAFAYIAAMGWDLLGIYHSHPRSRAIPSESDIREAAYPDLIQLVVSLRRNPPDIRAYRLRPDKGTAIGVLLDIIGGRKGKERRFDHLFSYAHGNWSVVTAK